AVQGGQDVKQRLSIEPVDTERHDIGFVVLELSKAMVKSRPEIELETCGIGLSRLDAKPRQMHRPFEAVGFLRRIDVESFPPNRIGLCGQRNHQRGEKLTARGYPFRTVEILRVVWTRGMLSYS